MVMGESERLVAAIIRLGCVSDTEQIDARTREILFLYIRQLEEDNSVLRLENKCLWAALEFDRC